MVSAKHTGLLGYVDRSNDSKGNLEKGLKHVRWKKIIPNDAHVFVKPNFTFPSFEKGITTSPILLEHLLTILTNRASRVTVVESNGGNNVFTAEEAFRGHGMNRICEELGVELVNLSNVPTTYVSERIGSKTVKVEVPKFLRRDVDCLVSVPVLKVHAMTSVTMSIKNLWGCYPNPMRCLYHENLDRKLALLVKMWKPSLCIIDGSYGLDGHGPMFGTPVKMNLIIASNNPVVADSLGARIMGFEPRKIGHIRITEDEGLGSSDISSVNVNRDWRKFHHKFSSGRTILDYFSLIPFHSGLFAKLIFQSPFTRTIRKVADIARTPEERTDLRSYVI